MNTRKINFNLPNSVNEQVLLYCKYVNLSAPQCLRFFISNQIIRYVNDRESYLEDKNLKRYHKYKSNVDYEYDEVKTFKDYSFNVSDYMYSELERIKNRLKLKSLAHLAVIMIKNELDIIFRTYYGEATTPIKKIKKIKYRTNIGCSNVMKKDLQNIANKVGITLNSLISNILMEYLISNYTDYYNNYTDSYNGIYNSSDEKTYFGPW